MRHLPGCTSQHFAHLIDGIIRKAGRPLEIRTGDLRLERGIGTRYGKVSLSKKRTSDVGLSVTVGFGW
jgi:hypothetical protein